MTPTLIHKKVILQGETYWLHDNLLSPLDHYDGDGNLLANPFRDVSYAFINDDGEIKRYRQVIGHFSDIREAQ